MSLIKNLILKQLDDLTELVEMTDSGDEIYESIRHDKEKLEVALTNPIVKMTEVETQLSYGITGRQISVIRSPRLTRIYFDVKSEEQARGYGLKQDKGEWYMNVWTQKLLTTDMKNFIASKGIPFPVTKYNAYGGRNQK